MNGMNLGTVLRKERKKRKLTLRVVSEQAGISQGFLSQVENDVSSPSVDTLVNICSAIGVDAGHVIKQAKKQERLVVIRKSDWEDVDFPPSGFVTRRFVSPENRSVFDSSILAIQPGGSIPVRKNVRNGQETLCILEGSIELIHGNDTIDLHEGDSVHFWSIPDRQKITNTSESVAVVFWAGTL
jgi:transcriptional regulator with XRE-family HTH domain